MPFEDRLYVADNANGVVKVFDKESGELLKTIGDKGEPTERLDRPTNLAFDAEGYLYVTDIGRFQVVKFDRDGHFQSTIGKAGDNPGHFARPKGIAVDREGRLYAVDASFNNVQIFNHDGRLLMFFGDAGRDRAAACCRPRSRSTTTTSRYFSAYAAPEFEIEYLVLVTSQFGERQVSVYGFGHEKGEALPDRGGAAEADRGAAQEELERLEREKPGEKRRERRRPPIDPERGEALTTRGRTPGDEETRWTRHAPIAAPQARERLALLVSVPWLAPRQRSPPAAAPPGTTGF